MKCCEIHAGQLIHPITIQSPTVTGDSMGGGSVTWSTAATVYAKIIPTSGGERWHGMRLEDNISHRIVIRYRNGITGKHRVLCGTRIMNIKSVIDIEERHEWLELQASEGQAT